MNNVPTKLSRAERRRLEKQLKKENTQIQKITPDNPDYGVLSTKLIMLAMTRVLHRDHKFGLQRTNSVMNAIEQELLAIPDDVNPIEYMRERLNEEFNGRYTFERRT